MHCVIYLLCYKVCQLLVHGRWFSPVSSSIKASRHDIDEINIAESGVKINHGKYELLTGREKM